MDKNNFLRILKYFFYVIFPLSFFIIYKIGGFEYFFGSLNVFILIIASMENYIVADYFGIEFNECVCIQLSMIFYLLFTALTLANKYYYYLSALIIIIPFIIYVIKKEINHRNYLQGRIDFMDIEIKQIRHNTMNTDIADNNNNT